MAKYVGLDWASRGWFGVVLDGDGDLVTTDLYPSMLGVWNHHSDAEHVFVDVPVGLPDDGRRPCDVEATDRLGALHRSVFYAPVRDAVYRSTIDEAKAENERAGFGVQNQAWSLVPRIREVDEFLDRFPTARDRLVETHPEVCFYGLNGQTPLDHSRHTDAGVAERRDLLADAHAGAGTLIEETVERYTTPSYAPAVGGVHDVLDALVAAVTAYRAPDGTSSLPRDPSRDARSLPMQIVYPTGTEQVSLTDL